MAVTKDDVKKIAELARLEYNDIELDNYTKEMNKVLEYVDKLNEINTKNVQPLSHPIENENIFREDVLKESVSTEKALKNAPNKTLEHFKVPKVISQNK